MATVGIRDQERKSCTDPFTAGSCQCGVSRMRAGGGKDLWLLASCGRNCRQAVSG